ncbi:hypothetical protein CEQ90_11835 [Lewinellaceae bacterium SD302]|nr:hypothetical protein CEQ90_11835 [Lewinellaceae bacterium SD302]
MRFLPSFVLATLVFFLTKDFPFFWDTIQLASKQASHIFYTGGLLLPDAIDSGHPPGFGTYLVGWWKIFGRKLWVSHLAMWPINLLLFHQLIRFCRYIGGQHWYWLCGIVLLEPVLLGQLCLVSPDLALLAFFLLLLNSVLQRNGFFMAGNSEELATITEGKVATPRSLRRSAKLMLNERQGDSAPKTTTAPPDDHTTTKPLPDYQTAITILLATLALSVISTRAWMAALVIFLIETIVIRRKFSFRTLLPYALGGIPAVVYLVTHYLAKGWIGYHEASPWAASLQTVGPGEMIFNVGILGWRMLDYGRFFLWLILGLLLLRNLKKIRIYLSKYRLLFSLILSLLGIIAIMTVPRSGMVSPRYFLPGIIIFDLTVIYLLFRETHLSAGVKKSLATLAFIGLLSGSFWVYPFRVAQAWDATPLHSVYHEHYTAALDYSVGHNIELESVGSVFPSIGPVDNRLLNGEEAGFPKFDRNQKYVFVAGIHNDFSDDELDYIEAEYTPIQTWRRLGVVSHLYQRR